MNIQGKTNKQCGGHEPPDVGHKYGELMTTDHAAMPRNGKRHAGMQDRSRTTPAASGH